MTRPLGDRYLAVLLGFGALLASGCGLVGSDSAGTNSDNQIGGSGGHGSDGGGSSANAGGGSASGSSGPVDAGCYRDPYLPDNYVPPCEQPRAVPNCTNGWCTIEPGCFIMGDSWCQWFRARSQNDPTQVTLTHRFRMQQFEVTQKLWTAESLPNPSTLFADSTGDCLGDNCPVGNVTWFETLAYANLLSQNEGIRPCYVLKNCQGQLGSGLLCDTVRSPYTSIYDCPGYRLPTGAEWEYAARAGTKTTVYTGDIVDTGHAPYTCYDEPHLTPIAWYCANSGPYTHSVGQKLPNDWGLYDVIGNAAEWSGSVAATYGPGPFVDWDAELNATGLLTLSSSSSIRQTRGGGWNQWPNTIRVGSQGGGSVGGPSGPGMGFRLVQTLSNASSGAP